MMVTQINEQEAARRGFGSKSALLAAALTNGDPIIVTTLQTFPPALDRMAQETGRRFAVIVDEAHQSQDGDSGRRLDETLGTGAVDEDEDLDAESVLEAVMRKRALAPHLTYVAFTATPRASTLTLFGRPDLAAPQQHVPFHLYTMRQAIEEGFILDVLRRYRSWNVSPILDGAGLTDERRMVEKRLAGREINRRIYENPDVIAAKAEIIVEHFVRNVAPLLGGRAKAMVVAYSRLAAVRYHAAIESAAGRKGIDLRTLVAFSGSVTDAGRTVTENSVNRSDSEPSEILKDDVRRTIVVANKYQTGFDQPLLSAMYLDKTVGGINAVQTLSRLNRTYPAAGKDTVFVVDFTDRATEIQEAFKRYYKEARLPQPVDPGQIHELRAVLDAVDVYDESDIADAATAAVAGDQQALDAVVARIVTEYDRRKGEAEEDDDADALDEILTFKANVSTFVDGYSFLSQVYDFGDAALERRYIVFRLLEKRLSGANIQRVDLSGLRIGVRSIRGGEERTLELGDGPALEPARFPVVDAPAEDPETAALLEIIEDFNRSVCDSLGVDPAVGASWLKSVSDSLLEDETLVGQAQDNSAEDFAESPDLEGALEETVQAVGGDLDRLRDAFQTNAELRNAIIDFTARLVHETARSSAAGRNPASGG
jgi:type I restriction enzyme R subunit